MSRRTTGMVFISIAAFLFGVRYLSAAMFASNVSSWSSDLFRAMLEYIGPAPKTLSIIALLAGIFYLLWAEFEVSRGVIERTKEQIKNNWNQQPGGSFFIKEEEDAKSD